MAVRVIDQAIVGKDNPFFPAVALGIIDIAFRPFPPLLIRHELFEIAEMVAANALAGCDLIERTLFLPTQLLGLFLGDVVCRQLFLNVDVRCYVLLVRIQAIFLDVYLSLLRRCRLGCIVCLATAGQDRQ